LANKVLMELLNAQVTESAANTHTEIAIQLPTSRSELLAMLVHQVGFELAPNTLIDTVTDDTHAQLRRRSATSILARSDPDLIASYAVFASVGKVVGAAEKAVVLMAEGYLQSYFDPPLLIARNQLYLAVESYNETVARYAAVRIGYTLEKVSERAFIAALVT